MEKNKFKNLDILQFTSIHTLHGMTTRMGGVSKDGFESLNLGMFSNDDRENVQENFEIFFDAVNIDKNKTVATHQTHSDHIVRIDKVDSFKVFEDTDGFASNVKGITLMTFYADCTPLFFYDPMEKVVAVAHSGWKGTAKKIGEKMIDFLVSQYGCSTENILVGIGPSISKSAFEVSANFMEEFKDREFFENYMNEDQGRYTFDIESSIRDLLIKRGILEKNIALSGLCTYNQSELFFSHRKIGEESGRMSGFIRLD